MKPDWVLRACAEKSGVIGIEAAPHTTLTERHRDHSIDSFMEHFEYVANLVGIDHVAFGPDTMFGDHVGIHHAFARQLSIPQSHQPPGHPARASHTRPEPLRLDGRIGPRAGRGRAPGLAILVPGLAAWLSSLAALPTQRTIWAVTTQMRPGSV
jgi:hypothetical protein